MDANERIVRLAVSEVLEIIRVAADGAQKIDFVGSQAMRGTYTGLIHRTDEIVAEVLKKL